MKPGYLIILLGLNFCWATVYSCYKILGQNLSSSGIVTIRFGLATLSLLVLWPFLPGATPRGRDLSVTCALGFLLFVVGQRLQVYGNQLGKAGDSAVLIALEPVVTSLLAAAMLGERIGPRRWIGFALGLSGVALLHGVWRSDFRLAGLNASLIFLSSFFCESVYSVVGKTIVERAGVLKMMAIGLGVGTVGNLLIDGRATLHDAATLPASGWLLLCFMAFICTSVCYALWFVVVRECPVNLAALTVFAQSVFGVIMAVAWLHEPFHLGQLLGCLTIVVGLVIGLSRQITPPHGQAAETR